jgi:hypothetical protein
MAEATTGCSFEDTTAGELLGLTSVPAHQNEEGEFQVRSSEPSESATTCAQVENITQCKIGYAALAPNSQLTNQPVLATLCGPRVDYNIQWAAIVVQSL